MRKPKSYFEQIPIELVKKIAEMELPADEIDIKKAATTAARLSGKPHRSSLVGTKTKEL